MGMSTAHEYSGHLYPQPVPDLAPDSSIGQVRVGELVVPDFNFCYKLQELQWRFFRGPVCVSTGLLLASIEALAAALG